MKPDDLKLDTFLDNVMTTARLNPPPPLLQRMDEKRMPRKLSLAKSTRELKNAEGFEDLVILLERVGLKENIVYFDRLVGEVNRPGNDGKKYWVSLPPVFEADQWDTNLFMLCSFLKSTGPIPVIIRAAATIEIDGRVYIAYYVPRALSLNGRTTLMIVNAEGNTDDHHLYFDRSTRLVVVAI